MFQSEHLQEKWAPLLEHEGCDKISDPHRRSPVTAVLLENQEKFMREQSAFAESGMLNEAPTNAVGAGGYWILCCCRSYRRFRPRSISLIRRSMPNLIAYDLAGVQC